MRLSTLSHLSPAFCDSCGENMLVAITGDSDVNVVAPQALDLSREEASPRDGSWPWLSPATGELRERMRFVNPGSFQVSQDIYTVKYPGTDFVSDTCTRYIVRSPTVLADSLACPTDISVAADAGKLTKTVTFSRPALSLSYPASDTEFHVGETTVLVYTSTAYCTFKVTVTMGE